MSSTEETCPDMRVQMNQIHYLLREFTSKRQRCGKYATTFALRNSVTDITIIAEGTKEQVFQRLGITILE